MEGQGGGEAQGVADPKKKKKKKKNGPLLTRLRPRDALHFVLVTLERGRALELAGLLVPDGHRAVEAGGSLKYNISIACRQYLFLIIKVFSVICVRLPLAQNIVVIYRIC
jgi:hypothetical protein